MPYPGPLHERVASASAVPRGLPLVIALTGFTDAGGAVAQLIRHFRDDLDSEPVVVFSNDVLLDYRARRPVITFNADHVQGYTPQRLELSLAKDAEGHPFLLLAGYEPDFVWDGFTREVLAFAREFAVSTVTWVHAIPMPVPHTRPIGTTVSGTRADLIAAHSVWQPHTQVPATVGHLLEQRFTEEGASIAGFVMLVPHYLGDTEYPAATLAALDSLTVAAGLVFDTDALREENRGYLAKVAEQVEESDDLTRMLAGLEERYDSYMAGSTLGQPIIHAGDLPSADELAAELERFLATRPDVDDKRGDEKRGGGLI